LIAIGLFLLNSSEGSCLIISGDPTGRTAYSAIVPALPDEVPVPGSSGSIKTTSLPALSSLNAIERPMTPPPKTVMSVLFKDIIQINKPRDLLP
jgi:hypothetical protein